MTEKGANALPRKEENAMSLAGTLMSKWEGDIRSANIQMALLFTS